MKRKIKYYLSKFLVLLVALHTIDVSVDIDHLTAHASWSHTGHFDDMDSFSEFILEKIFKNDNLVTENKADDQHPGHKFINKSSQPTVYIIEKDCYTVSPAPFKVSSGKPLLRDTLLIKGDYSSSDYNPPDFAVCA